ncbi:hypothetical protein ACNOYE_13555 [Nannocystaceae bacterium ST9]
MRLPLALFAALSGDPELGATQTLELDWTADAACPSEVEVRERIAAMLVGASSEALQAWALVRDRGADYELDLSWQLGPWREHRIVHGHDCDELARIAAMLLASTVDPFGLIPRGPEPEFEATPVIAEPKREPAIQVPKTRPARTPALEPTPEPAPTPTPTPTIVEVTPAEPELQIYIEPEPEPEPNPRLRALRGLVLAEGLGFVNVLPRPGGGARLGVGLEHAKFRVLAAGSAWFGPGFRSPTNPELGGDLWAWSLELSPCGLPRWRRLEFPICGQVGAGQVMGRGVGVSGALSTGRPWVWLGADASLAWWPRPGFGLFAGVGLGASLVRPRFGLAGTDAEFTIPVVFGRLHAGVAFRFGGRQSRSRPETDRRDPDRQATR